MNYLNQYPVNAAPDTWPMNGICLRSIQNLRKYWKDRGYTLKSGQEHEFNPRTVEDFDKFVKQCGESTDDLLTLSSHLAPSLDLYKRYKADPVKPDIENIVNGLIDYVRQAKTIPALCRTLKTTRNEIVEHLSAYQRDLKSEDEEIKNLAHRNAYLAFLHLMPSSAGGIADLIQPRFGSYAYGVGWWDWPGNAEVRTPPTSNPFALIRATHKIIDHIFKSAEAFQIAPCFDIGCSHIHFSLWHDATGRNVMRMETPEDKALAERMLTGLYTMYAEAPQLLNDVDPSNSGKGADLRASGFRSTMFRQTGETWELRRSHTSGFCHTARDIAMIMGGTAYGAFGLDDVEAHRKQHAIRLRHAMHPIVENRFDGAPALMHRVVEASFINDDGSLTPGPHVMSRYVYDLKEEIGKKNYDCFTAIPPGKRKPRNLHWNDTWTTLIKSIRLNDDNTLAIHHLHPDIQALFTSLKITGRRPVLDGGEYVSRRGITRLKDRTADLTKSSALRFVIGQKSIPAIQAHFEKTYPEKAKQIGVNLALSQLLGYRKQAEEGDKGSDEDEENVAFERAADMYDKFLTNALSEELSDIAAGKDYDSSLITGRDPAFLTAGNSLQTISPHFKKAIEDHIDKLRHEGRNNYLISQMHDLLDYVDRDMLDFRKYIRGIGLGTCLTPARKIWCGESEDKVYRKERASCKATLTLFFQLAAQDPRYSKDDLLSMIDDCKIQAREIFAKEKAKLKLSVIDEEKKKKKTGPVKASEENKVTPADKEKLKEDRRNARKDTRLWFNAIKRSANKMEPVMIEELDALRSYVMTLKAC